jgi:D-alanyl-D-alanine dipeptidase
VGARQAKIGSSQAEASRISADAAMLTAKSSGNRAVASMRIKWVEELRQVLSEYHSILMTVDGERTEEDRRRLANLGTKLDLMMNLNEEDQKRRWQVAEEDIERRRALDNPLMVAGRLVLKNEWEKIKLELRG